MTHTTRRLMAGASVLGVCGLIAANVAVGAKSTAKHTHGIAYVAVTHTVGKIQYAAGNATDSVLGSGAVTYSITLGTGTKPGTFKVIANPVTVFTKTGALSGKGTATLTVTSTGLVFSNGKLDLTKGTGGQKGHSFVGTFTGSAKSATGPFVFKDKGIYK